MGDSNVPVTEGVADRGCVVEFFHVPSGGYQLTVVGPTIQDTATDVQVNSSDVSDIQDIEVRVRRAGETSLLNGLPVNSLISSADLGVPAVAAKEFTKAYHLIEKEDWHKAIERLQKAVTIYPNFAAAYNNLGVAYSYAGDPNRGREALQRAISIAERLAPAYVNLSRISIKANDFPEAETLLDKAAAIAPVDSTTLVLLAYVEARNGHLDEAIATSRRAHAATPGHAFVHLAAAHAFEQKGKIGDSIAELNLFLAEDPTSPQAETVRKAISTLEATAR
jgi:tetratricopeptide (TPR) repeat protein